MRSFETDAFLLVQPRFTEKYQLSEAQRLAKTYSGEICKTICLGKRKGFLPNAATYFGKGHIEQIKNESIGKKEILINAVLTGVQVRNLESELNIRVLDRIGLIVNIFAQRARTREAKLQVELACLQLARTRLVRVLDASGRPSTFGIDGSEVVSARERSRGGGGMGGLGGGGQGEKEIILQQSRIDQKIRKLKNQIERIKHTRNVHRSHRQRIKIPVVAVVGYTNAGKSTLVNKLTKSELECDDLYFKTLDPITRRMQLPFGKLCLVSDTVGFISDLPISLFAAFRATLEEACHADVILHVVDVASHERHRQRLEVYRVVGVSQDTLRHRTIEAYNKTDAIENQKGSVLYLKQNGRQLLTTTIGWRALFAEYWIRSLNDEEPGFRPKRVMISALTGFGLERLKNELEVLISKKRSS